MEEHTLDVYYRESAELKDFGRFKIPTKNFHRQYSSIYVARLAALRGKVVEKATAKWEQCEVIKICQLVEKSQNEACILIGTLYKHQELKPSILRELSEELQIVPQPARSNYASFKDTLFLEDEMLRVLLIGKHMDIKDIVTGLVCAVMGYQMDNDKFSVIDWCFPGCCPKPALSNPEFKSSGKVLFISGLDIVNNLESLTLNLLSEWINGMIGCKDSQHDTASILCVIIAGNSVRGSIETHNHKGYFQTKSHDEVVFKKAAMSAHILDQFLHTIVQCCPVILLPGEFDPVCYAIPQQPFHPCILPQSARFKSLHAVTNPWVGSINSCTIAGTSGQPIVDIMKVAGLTEVSPLTWLERTLNWQHFAPTAPDTLPAYPYFEDDPFIMKEYPDIYFAGNMEEYDTKLITADQGQVVRLICIPKFSKTQTAVLVNLTDLETSPISFGAGFLIYEVGRVFRAIMQMG